MLSSIARPATTFLLVGLLTACGTRNATLVASTPSPTPAELPAALFGGSERPDSVIDGKHAIAVVEAMWPIREKALHDRDVALLQQIETGPALAVDIARTCFCPQHVIRPQHDPLVVVQRQTSYPAVFLGSVVTRSQTVDQYQGHPAAFIANMVFTRSDRSSPWRLAIWSGYTGAYDYGNFEIPQWDPTDRMVPGSWSFSLPPPSHPGLNTSRLAATLAADWQSWADRGVGVPSSPFSSVYGQSMRSAVDYWKAKGVTAHWLFRPDPSVGVYEFALFDKNDMACTAVDYEKTLTPGKTSLVFHQGDDQTDWGPALDPGDYQSITFSGVVEVCLYIQPGHAAIEVYTPGLMDTDATGNLARQLETTPSSTALQSA